MVHKPRRFLLLCRVKHSCYWSLDSGKEYLNTHQETYCSCTIHLSSIQRPMCSAHAHQHHMNQHALSASHHWAEHSSWEAETSCTRHFQLVSPLTKSQRSATQCSHPVHICIVPVFCHEEIKLLKANIKSFNMITLRFSFSCLEAIIKTCLRDKINPQM